MLGESGREQDTVDFEVRGGGESQGEAVGRCVERVDFRLVPVESLAMDGLANGSVDVGGDRPAIDSI